MPNNTHPHTFDVIAIGGGVAGLSAALLLARARRSVLVVDAGQPRNAPAERSHGYLSRDGVAPLELVRLGRTEVEGYGGTIVQGTVTSLEQLADDDFQIQLADGTSWRARRVLVTTGLVDQLPELPGLRELWGRDVVHCPYCFGWDFRDQPLGVLGTSSHAVTQALLWRQWSSDVILFLHAAPHPTNEQMEQLAARGIRVVSGEVAAVETRDGSLSGVRLASGQLVERRALIVAPRFVARSEILAGLGIHATEHPLGIGSHVKADPTGKTDVRGVWVAGNVADLSASVVQSAASGTTAAAAINADLVAEDATRAVAGGPLAAVSR